MEKQLPGLAPQHLRLGEEGESEKPTEPRPKGKARFPGLTLSLCPLQGFQAPGTNARGYVTCSRVCKQNGKAREQCYLSHAPLECSRASLQGPLALLQEPAPSVTPSGLSDRQPCVMEPGLAQGKQQAR